MNKTYVFGPLLALSLFGYIYRHADADRVALETRREAVRVAKQKAEDERNETARRKAGVEASFHAAEREREAREAAEKKRRDQEAVVQKITDEAVKQETEAARLERDAAELAGTLAQLRGDRETVEREAFTLAREVEQKRVERRNAELEVQRATRMFIARLDRSTSW